MALKNIVLIGFMGTGKTSVGRILARKLRRELIDIDGRIEKQEGRRISEIFAKEGEPYFRKVEKLKVMEAVSRHGAVITTGGGAVVDPENLQALASSGILICLSSKPETIFKRVKDSPGRPLLQGTDKLAQIKRLMEARGPFYAKAEMQFETDGLSSWQVASLILKKLEGQLK